MFGRSQDGPPPPQSWTDMSKAPQDRAKEFSLTYGLYLSGASLRG